MKKFENLTLEEQQNIQNFYNFLLRMKSSSTPLQTMDKHVINIINNYKNTHSNETISYFVAIAASFGMKESYKKYKDLIDLNEALCFQYKEEDNTNASYNKPLLLSLLEQYIVTGEYFVDENGNCPYSPREFFDLIEYFLQEGAKIDPIFSYINKEDSVASLFRNEDLANLFFKYGFDVNAVDKDSLPIVTYAFSSAGYSPSLKLFLDNDVAFDKFIDNAEHRVNIIDALLKSPSAVDLILQRNAIDLNYLAEKYNINLLNLALNNENYYASILTLVSYGLKFDTSSLNFNNIESFPSSLLNNMLWDMHAMIQLGYYDDNSSYQALPRFAYKGLMELIENNSTLRTPFSIACQKSALEKEFVNFLAQDIKSGQSPIDSANFYAKLRFFEHIQKYMSPKVALEKKENIDLIEKFTATNFRKICLISNELKLDSENNPVNPETNEVLPQIPLDLIKHIFSYAKISDVDLRTPQMVNIDNFFAVLKSIQEEANNFVSNAIKAIDYEQNLIDEQEFLNAMGKFAESEEAIS
jgi:hypothetical protein